MAPRSQTCVFVCFFPSYSWELTAKISSADWVYKAIFFYSRLFCILLTKIQYQKRPQRAIRLSTCTANHSRPPSWSLFFPSLFPLPLSSSCCSGFTRWRHYATGVSAASERLELTWWRYYAVKYVQYPSIHLFYTANRINIIIKYKCKYK